MHSAIQGEISVKGTYSHEKYGKGLKILIEKLGRKRRLERSMHRRTGDIMVNLK
jgi:hypothetical protein